MSARGTAKAEDRHDGPPATGPATRIVQERAEAERMAWTALARYKFVLFGYWSGVWIHLNRIAEKKQPNPWTRLVRDARAHLSTMSGDGA